jgi:myo-inositol-1(or 4)-monophosphatase
MEKIKIQLVNLLTKEIEEIFQESNERKLEASFKDDKSIVTEIDLLVSKFLKEKLSENSDYKNYSFFSEEDYDQLIFPAAIIDPIDGTREFAIGRPECAVSIALMRSSDILDPNNYAWLYNPFSGFSMDSKQLFVHSTNHSIKNISGMVSRSENHLGLYNNIKNAKIIITPRGSIAFKLGLLASGAIDFVVSKYPKNIWDIAAGTILASKRGYHFYVNGKRVHQLNQVKVEGILIWAKESQIAELYKEFQK